MSIFSSFNRNIFLATSSLLVASSLFLSVPAQAISVIHGAYDQSARKYVFDAPNSNFNSGTQVVVWPYHNDSNQDFSYPPIQKARSYAEPMSGEIKIAGKCLDAFGGLQTGTVIGLWGCHGGENQIWSLRLENPEGINQPNYSAKYSIRPSSNQNYCIDAAGTLAPGSKLILWQCHGGPNQIWRPDTMVYIHNS